MNGIYAMYYTGAASSGHGLLMLRNGKIVGADMIGALYDGEYTLSEDEKTLSGVMKMQVPLGAVLVTGASFGMETPTIEIPFSVPANLGGGNPLTIKTPTGPINMVFKRLRGIDE